MPRDVLEVGSGDVVQRRCQIVGFRNHQNAQF